MTIFGWDMSHYDAPSLGTAVKEGIRFVTHKAGGDADDAELDDWWNSARSLDGVLLGAYWVLYPGRPAARADAFLARLDQVCHGWRDRPFILQVDCEKWAGDPGTVPSRSDIRAFCDRLVDRASDYRPVVYGPKWVYGDSLTGLGYPLWASSYVTGAGGFRALYPGDQSARWAPYSGQTPAILQYTSSATIGGQTTCDANAYRGTLEQLTALVAPGKVDDMPLTDADLDKIEQRARAAVKDEAYGAVNQDRVQRYVAGAPVPKNPDKPGDETMTWASALAYVNRDTDVLRRAVTATLAQLATLAGKDFVDEQAVVDGVLAGIGANRPPGEVAAILRAVPGVDWAAVGAKLTGSA